MFLKNNKYLGVKPASSFNELLLNSAIFYLIPNFILLILFNFQIGNYLSFYMGYGTFIFYPVLLLMFIMLNVLATINILVILQKDYQVQYSSFKKIVLFLLMQIPFAIHANLATILLTKKYPVLKYRILFFCNYLLISIIILVTKNILTVVFIQSFENKMNPKDGYIRMETDVVKTTTKYLNQSFALKAPLFIELNLPKGFRANSKSVHRAQGALVEFRNSCSNCLDSKRLEKPIQFHYLPIGSKILVIDGFSLEDSRTDKYLIVKDEQGHTAEISELGFELSVLKADKNFDYDANLLGLIEEYQSQQFLDRMICSNFAKDSNFEQLKSIDPFKYGQRIEPKVYKFIKDFNLEDQIELTSSALAGNQNYSMSCAQLKFKTINSLALFFYYGGDWGFLDTHYEISEFDKVQTSPALKINHSEFIKFSEDQVLQQYP